MKFHLSLPDWLVGLPGRVGSRVGGAIGVVRERPRSVLSTGLVAVAAVGVLVAVLLSDGFVARTYDLDDAYVWVTQGGAVERYNNQTRQIDWQDSADDGEEADVVQDGTDVLVSGAQGWSKVDVAEQKFEQLANLATVDDVQVGGGTVAVLGDDGKVWVAPFDQVSRISTEDQAGGKKSQAKDEDSDNPGDSGKDSDSGKRDVSKPALDAGKGAVIAVSRSGDVAVLTGKRDRLVVIDGKGSQPTEIPISADVADSDSVEVSFVGRRPVALVGSLLILPDGSVRDLKVDVASLQLPGDEADSVLVATGEDLLSVPLGGGEPESLTDGVKFVGDASSGPLVGIPARPVSIAGQKAAAWAGAGARVFWSVRSGRVAQMMNSSGGIGNFSDAAAGQLQFRVNRNAVVLNRVDSGEVFVYVDGRLDKSEWQDVRDATTSTIKDEESQENKILEFDPTKNKPPKARDDEYGVRPGFPTIIHPLDNDSDADNDVLTIELDDPSVKAARVTVDYVEGKQGLQVTPDGDVSPGTQLKFKYQAYDGSADPTKGMSKLATVTLTVYGPSDNKPPELKPGRGEKPPSMEVVAGSPEGSSYQVLQDYVDPEGDPFYLSKATPKDPATAEVAFRSSGRVTYIDRSGQPVETSVVVKITDAPMVANAQSASVDADLKVSVRPAESDLPPIARNDHVSTLKDVPVVIRPLVNDEDPNGDQMSFKLVGLDHLDRNEISVVESANNTVTVTAKKPGQVTFGYELKAGGLTATARIRVDVIDPSAKGANDPKAALDLVVLPRPTEGSSAERTVDLLANDFSPTGDILAVTSVESGKAKDLDLTAQLLELRRLRVSSNAPPAIPVTFGYTLSDGRRQTEGAVVVVGSSDDRNAPPVAVDDKVTVRSGDVVSVPVLANDIDPEGARLYLDPKVDELSGKSGVVWASGSRVRFVAPDVQAGQTKTLSFAYTVYDGDDFKLAKKATGKLQVRVTNPGEKTNSPPKPEPVEARVLSGKQVKITVPTAGIDPDGDSVQIVGVGFNNGVPDAPKKGRIVGEPSVDSFVYEALDGQAGTDVFSYVVADSHGDRGVGQVRVGVAESDRNNPPVAYPDKYQAKPGQPMTLDVLLNDLDSDGDPIALVDDDPFMGTGGGLSPHLVKLGGGGDGVRVNVPNKNGEQFTFRYEVSDPVGETSSALVTLHVTDGAIGQPPVARDDRAVLDGTDAKSVKVPVLVNDADPDGDVAELTIKVVGSIGKVVRPADGLAQIEVPLTDEPQIVVYSVTDNQLLVDYAVVRVPAAGTTIDSPPIWKPSGPCAKQVKIANGETEPGIVFDGADKPTTIDLAKCGFSDPEGKPVRFSSGGSINKGVTAKLSTVVREGGLSFEIADTQGGTTPYQDVISLVVTDGGSNETGNEVLVQIPVGVTATSDKAENQPPKWTASATIKVTQDGEPSRAIDLKQLVKDVEGDKLTFEVAPLKGVKVDGGLSDGKLVLTGSKDLSLGSAGNLTVTVTDKKSEHKEVAQTFAVNGIKTHKAPPTLKPHATVDDATLNKPSTVNVLEGAADPLGDGLKLISVDVGSNPGKAVPNVSGELTFTPGEVGPATVSFVVADSLERTVTGTVTYAVAAPPGPPGAPSALDFTFDSVSLRWSQAEDNRSEITRYDVTATPGGATASCGIELSCTVTGLTPGIPYTFTVTATNEKGEGKPSPPSPPITPDECPAAPQNVQLIRDTGVEAGGTNPREGGQLLARWETPNNNGTPIEGYQITVEPGGQVLTPAATATEQVISGLENGTEHNLTIKARNRCDATFGDDAIAGPAIPAGVPDAPTNVNASPILDEVGGRVQLKWSIPSDSNKPNNNGDEVTDYIIEEVNGRRAPENVQAEQVSIDKNGFGVYEIKVEKSAADLQFVINAINHAGTSDRSAVSPKVSAPSAPSAPTIRDVKTSDNGVEGLDGRVRVILDPPPDTGGPTSLALWYEYSMDRGQWKRLDSDRIISGVKNGESHSFRIRANNYMRDTSDVYAGKPSNEFGNVIAYGPLATPTLTGSNAASGVPYVTFSWAAPPSNGRRITSVSVTVDGSHYSSNSSGSGRSGNAWSHSFPIIVSVRDEAGQTALIKKSWSTGAEPKPTITIWWGDPNQVPGCSSELCSEINGSLANFPKNTTVTLHCWMSGESGSYYHFTVNTNNDGKGSFEGPCVFGYPASSSTYLKWNSFKSNDLSH